ncbi:saccharopine dehydrogenase NADP-binding domain-containing protein [Dactylosporangium vinaceum]|uniref:Saccharopine dehydrogenase NADP-binding domain-containing protein n=1 Tax=Dactylosporangium vinaceum TaxID=53362 RepID=A0ABV5M3F7_9ACTN|nr:saccharopine dehydrogenase NADP-binding domain-containing protein [Dactylosporangium vinaceum]UAB99791.1 saccharopine dehydrogenase NADP-binding domain-containing protein [Dactylosporangium vinaceum]
MTSPSGPAVAVYGAYGHTAQFLVAALHRRGIALVLSGRDAARLHALAARHPGAKVRPAALDVPAELDRALDGATIVVNCAGPFGDTPPALVDAALRAGAHYLDVAGETLVVWRMFERPEPPADLLAVPAVGFFGGLGDLLATAAYGSGPPADAVSVAVALDGWVPTRGSRLAGKLRAGRRVVFSNGRLHLRTGAAAPTAHWTFPPPFGPREAETEFPTADVVTIARHLLTREIRTYLHTAPTAAEPHREQRFVVEVTIHRGGGEHRVSASGRDIYAFSAAMAAEAAVRVVHGDVRATGLVTAGQAFPAADFLGSLPLDHLDLS